MKITLLLFGAFRSFGEQFMLSLPENAIVSDMREELLKEIMQLDSNFKKKELIESSRFATETEVLRDDQPLQNEAVIAIIPPVAGG